MEIIDLTELKIVSCFSILKSKASYPKMVNKDNSLKKNGIKIIYLAFSKALENLLSVPFLPPAVWNSPVKSAITGVAIKIEE